MAGKIEQRYGSLQQDRNAFLVEAHKAANLTVPSLFPEPNDARTALRNSARSLPKPHQSLGARGVRNLASKLLLTLFPPEGTFIRYLLSPEMRQQIQQLASETGQDAGKILNDLQGRLAEREQTLMDEVETGNFRTKAFEALRLLIVTGNALVYLPPEGGMRVFPLNQYTVRRDFMGNVVEIILVEVLDRATAPPKVAAVLESMEGVDPEEPTTQKRHARRSRRGKRTLPADIGQASSTDRDKPVFLYTHIERRKNRMHFRQEVMGEEVPGSTGSTRLDESPWLALRFVSIDGEDYGRGLVEEFGGDLKALDGLRRAIKVAALNAAKLIPLVSPNATIRPKNLVEAANGEPLVGREGDVVMLQQNKHADMQVAQVEAQELKRDLSSDFLLTSSIQRNGERVTAEEIRRLAQDLEDSLGGIFSNLSTEFQLPVALRTEARLIRSGALSKLEPRGAVRPAVVTGLAALGRGHELQRLREGLAFTAEVVGAIPEAADHVNGGEILRRGWQSIGVKVEGMLNERDEVEAKQAQRQQQAVAQEMLSKGTGPGVGAIGGLLQQLTQAQGGEAPSDPTEG